MKKEIFFVILFIILNSASTTQGVIKQNTILFKFLSKQDEQAEIGKQDSHTVNLTKIDYQMRLKRKDATNEEFFEAMNTDIEEWTDEEKAVVEEALITINDRLNKLSINLELPEISFIKSKILSELGADGFTRGYSIYLSKDKLPLQSELKKLIAHEIFHIVTRYNPDLRKSLYSLIGFTVLTNEIDIPIDIKERIISNPDVERHDSYARFMIEGSFKDCMLVFYLPGEYVERKTSFNNLRIGLLSLDNNKSVIQENGKTITYKVKDATNLYDLIGKNTSYIIDPEEILAENFRLLLFGKESSEIDTKMLEKLQE